MILEFPGHNWNNVFNSFILTAERQGMGMDSYNNSHNYWNRNQIISAASTGLLTSSLASGLAF